VVGEMDDADASPQAVGAPPDVASPPVPEPDAADLENLPARRRSVVIEYFRALRAAANPTTQPNREGTPR
jgi:hypothetical protein